MTPPHRDLDVLVLASAGLRQAPAVAAAARDVVRVEEVGASADDDVEALTARMVELVGRRRAAVVLDPGAGPVLARAAEAACRRTDAELWTLSASDDSPVRRPGRECADTALDDLHAEQEDPWGTDDRWYEARKRDLLLAVLPRRRHGRALEVGCSAGALAAVLRERVTSLVAADRSPAALRAARERLGTTADLRLMDLPHEWPEGSFDLVVVSEVGYFLSPSALDLLVERVAGCLERDGTVLLSHWRHPVAGWALDGPDVHERFAERLGRPLQAAYDDRDVQVRVHAHDPVWPDPSR